MLSTAYMPGTASGSAEVWIFRGCDTTKIVEGNGVLAEQKFEIWDGHFGVWMQVAGGEKIKTLVFLPSAAEGIELGRIAGMMKVPGVGFDHLLQGEAGFREVLPVQPVETGAENDRATLGGRENRDGNDAVMIAPWPEALAPRTEDGFAGGAISEHEPDAGRVIGSGGSYEKHGAAPVGGIPESIVDHGGVANIGHGASVITSA